MHALGPRIVSIVRIQYSVYKTRILPLVLLREYNFHYLDTVVPLARGTVRLAQFDIFKGPCSFKSTLKTHLSKQAFIDCMRAIHIAIHMRAIHRAYE